MASIRETSGVLQIVSKLEFDTTASIVNFFKGQRQKKTEYLRKFGAKGTRVTVMEFMFNMPVR